MSVPPRSVDYFPYAPGVNPYQSHFKDALESAGIDVVPIAPRKLFPLTTVAKATSTVAHFDWISDLYIGRDAVSTLSKRVMFEVGLRQLAHRKTVWTVHNLFTHDSPVPMARETELIRGFLRQCDGLLFLSQRSMEEFVVLHPAIEERPMRHGRIGHFADDYPNDRDRGRARRALKIAEDQRVVLQVGRLQPYKGVEELINAFATVARSTDTLVLAGQPASAAYAERLTALARSMEPSCRGHIRLSMARIETERMQDYCNAADVAVMPFRKILNSASVLLAASFGVPVVAPAIGSVPEYVPSAVGWTYDPKSRDLTEVVRVALEAPPESDAARANRIEFVRRHFSWSDLATTTVSLYDEILDTTPVRG